jgi:isopenicillin-N epimerase
MPTRRDFLRSLGRPAALAATASLNPEGFAHAVQALAREGGSPEEDARDEALWAQVQQAFAVDRSLINLNNGGVSPAPELVQQALKRHLDFSNTAPVVSMWRVLEPQLETVRAQLARMFGCQAEEVAVVRNASEGLQICQCGFDFRAGDEVVTSNQDYGRMINTWQQRERRDGIRLVQVSLPVPAEDPAEVVRRFESAITPRTRLIHMCHMINLTGQILPVKAVVQMARSRGIPVIVDGAHAFAHFQFTHADLDCDYYATSLHKWLFAPIGTGMLFVRRERIRDLWPLQASPETLDDDIRKFEEIGTHPAANHLAVAEAVRFTEAIGMPRKEARLVYLRDRWAQPLSRLDRVRLHTSLKPGFACGLANVQIEGIDPGELAEHLWSRHRIIVTPIKHAEFEGIRVTPNVYSTLAEIDLFTEVMADIARKGG